MTSTAVPGTRAAAGEDRAARWRLAALGGTFLAVAVLTYVLAVRRARGQLVDEAMKAFWLPLRRDVSDVGRALFPLLGWPLLLAGVALAAVTCIARRDVVLGVLGAAILVGGPAVVWSLQRLLHRPISDDRTYPLRNTLPSGHASVAAAVALAVLLVARPARRGPALVGALVIAGVGVLIPAASAAHRPSDVAASYLVVGAWTAVVLLVAGRGAPAARTWGLAALVVSVGLGAGAAALGAVLVLVAQAPDHLPDSTNLLWVVTVVLVTAVAVVVVASLAPALVVTGRDADAAGYVRS